jgi:hypothetical protein
MSLARAWRRQLYGASSVALIVPSAMLTALVVLALGGGFSQVGVLGQIFAGPSAPSAAGGAGSGRAAGLAAGPLPAIPSAAASPRLGRGSVRSSAPSGRRVVPVVSRGPSQTGGALTPVHGVAPVVGGGRPVAPRPAPTGSAPSRPAPRPGPSRQPTVVDRIVNTVTPVTQELPGPVGPVATQALEAAGSAADGVLPPGAGPGLKLP